MKMMLVSVICMMVTLGCTDEKPEGKLIGFDLQGHRGTRGLLPENTIPAFKRALEIGVTTLEMDVVLTSEGMVVVSHDPWFSSQICSHPDGSPITESEEKDLRLFDMTYEEVKKYDCGSRGHPKFPDQEAMVVFKPLLSDVIKTSETHTDSQGSPGVYYNIEIKSAPDRDGLYYKSVAEYARQLYAVLVDGGVLDRSFVQSFDPRALEMMHEIDPALPLGLLVNNDDGLITNLERLSFTPVVYSPHERLVDAALVDSIHERNIRIIPWTVNQTERMKELLSLGVDGIITDYPDRGKALFDDQGNQE